MVTTINNRQIAASLNEVADLLEAQQANAFRVRAYRRGAEAIASLAEPVVDLMAREGEDALRRLPGIGVALTRTIARLARGQELGLLQRLRGETPAEDLLSNIPGIGRCLAARIHGQLGISTLEELEQAAHDGRLATVPGIGRKRTRAIRDSLAAGFRFDRRNRPADDDSPQVQELLDIDREYRAKAAADRLLRIAPRRFNPQGLAWLPILHTRRGVRHYTALFSNTALAHKLARTHDWVVIYRDDSRGDGQWTAVTARNGPLRGQRVIRGREDECLESYRNRRLGGDVEPAVQRAIAHPQRA